MVQKENVPDVVRNQRSEKMGGSYKIHINFYMLPKPKGRKTYIWEIITLDRTHLGYIKFDGAWRQFICEPADDTKWSASCFDQISAFLKEQSTEWRNSIKRRSK